MGPQLLKISTSVSQLLVMPLRARPPPSTNSVPGLRNLSVRNDTMVFDIYCNMTMIFALLIICLGHLESIFASGTTQHVNEAVCAEFAVPQCFQVLTATCAIPRKVQRTLSNCPLSTPKVSFGSMVRSIVSPLRPPTRHELV